MTQDEIASSQHAAQRALDQFGSGLVHSREIVWTDFDGTKHRVMSGWYANRSDANQWALKLASDAGWTRPRWWQLWRRSDTPSWYG